MAPGILSDDLPVREGTHDGKTSYPKPLELSGALESFDREDTTPVRLQSIEEGLLLTSTRSLELSSPK